MHQQSITINNAHDSAQRLQNRAYRGVAKSEIQSRCSAVPESGIAVHPNSYMPLVKVAAKGDLSMTHSGTKYMTRIERALRSFFVAGIVLFALCSMKAF